MLSLIGESAGADGSEAEATFECSESGGSAIYEVRVRFSDENDEEQTRSEAGEADCGGAATVVSTIPPSSPSTSTTTTTSTVATTSTSTSSTTSTTSTTSTAPPASEDAVAANGGESADCTALTEANIECTPPDAPAADSSPECPYLLDYPSTVPATIRLESLGIYATDIGFVVFGCSSTGVRAGDVIDATWPAGWRITMTVGEPSTPDSALFVGFDDEAFFGLTNGFGAGFVVPQSFTNAGDTALTWLTGQPDDGEPETLTWFSPVLTAWPKPSRSGRHPRPWSASPARPSPTSTPKRSRSPSSRRTVNG